MSLAKDVERLGDYAKNLSELIEIRSQPLPSGVTLNELQAIRRGVEHAFRPSSEVFVKSKKDQALELIEQGREMARRCDRLIVDIGHGDYDAATTAVTFGPRGALFSGGDDFAIYRWQRGQPQEID